MNLLSTNQLIDEHFKQLILDWTDTPHEKQVSDYLRIWGRLQQVLVLYAATPPHNAMIWVKGRERFLKAIEQAQEQFPLLPTRQVDSMADLTESIAQASQLLLAIIESFEERNLDAFFAWIDGTEVFLEAIRRAQELYPSPAPVVEERTITQESKDTPSLQAKRAWPIQKLSWYQYAALLLLNGALAALVNEQTWIHLLTGALLIASSFLIFEQPWSTSKHTGTPGWLHLFLQASLCILLPLIMAFVLHTLLPLIGVIAIGWLAWRDLQAKRQA